MEHNLLRILISLKILLASIARLKAVWIFLIATSSLFILSNADQTTPYAPDPIICVTSYRSSTITSKPDQNQ